MQDINFKIEKIEVKAKSRPLLCKCGKPNTMMVAPRLELKERSDEIVYEFNRFGLRCESCFNPETEIEVNFGQ